MSAETLLAATRAFVAEVVLPSVAVWDRNDALPDEATEALLAIGITGALVPEAFGGPGLGVRELVPVWRELSHGWISLTGMVNPTGLATTLLVRLLAVEALVNRAAEAVDSQIEDARAVSTVAKVVASEAAVWGVDQAARLAASRSYASGDELARLRRDAPQTQIGEGANDALLMALSRDLLD